MKKIALCLYITLFFTNNCLAPEKIPTKKIDPYWNDLAVFLAGMPVRQGSLFEELIKSEAYKKHSSIMNKFWNMIKKENISRINPWRMDNIPQNLRVKTAFYPFSGADFINLYTLFPNSTNYIMIALEEPGRIPEPLKLSPSELASGLSAIQRSISNIASENYFKSAIMQKEMTNKYLEGTTPILLIFAARLGLNIQDVSAAVLDEAGKIQRLNKDDLLNDKKYPVYGSRIIFSSKETSEPRTLTYLKMRLHNSSLNEKSAEGQFFKKLNGSGTIIKSAVYLLHRESFNELCRYIMNISDIIVQDDSGIPFRYFSKRTWNISLFGTYTSPRSLKDLPDPPAQPDLAKAYKERTAPLPFNFGYGVLTGKGMSNLLLATKSKK